MSRRNWVMAAAILAAGFAGGRLLDPDRSSTPPASPRAAVTTHERIIHASPGAIDREVLREELRTVLAEMKPTVEHDESSREPARERELTDAQRAAETKGKALVADAITRGRWGHDAGAQLHAAMSEMTNEQRMATLASLMDAINRGEVTPESPILF